MKTEPRDFSFSDLVRGGRTRWDGITGPAALAHLRNMRPGDRVIVYHSGAEKAAVGVATVASEPYADPASTDPRRVVVDLVPVAPLPRPVTLAEIKADPTFAACDLVRFPRLSVMPVPATLGARLLAGADVPAGPLAPPVTRAFDNGCGAPDNRRR